MAYKATGILRATSPAITVIQNRTSMCWIYINSTSEKGEALYIGADQNGAGDAVGIGVGGTSTGNLGNDAQEDLFAVANNDTNVAFGTGWHHIAAVDRNGAQYVYVDGVFAASFSNALSSAPDDFTWVGENASPTGGGALGADNRVAHCKAWNSALSTAQIQVEMNSGFPVFNYDTLAMYWPIEKSGGYGTANAIDFTQKLSAIGVVLSAPRYDDNPPVARC